MRNFEIILITTFLGLLWSSCDREKRDNLRSGAGDLEASEQQKEETSKEEEGEKDGSFLGSISGEVIYSDPVATSTAPSWNERLPKIVSDGTWSYAVHSHISSDVNQRYAKIFVASESDHQWTEANRLIEKNVQPVGISLDHDGKIHLLFDCAANQTCSTGGIVASATQRLYNLVFFDKDSQGKIRFDSTFANFDEFTDQSFGYYSMAVNAAKKETYVSSARAPDFTQHFLLSGGYSLPQKVMPKIGSDHFSLYPFIAVSDSGRVWYAQSELIKAWSNSAQYEHLSLRNDPMGANTLLMQDTVSNPDGIDRWLYISDMTFDSKGNGYLLYFKTDGTSCGNYLAVENASQLGSATEVLKCSEFAQSYAKLHVDGSDNLYLITRRSDSPKIIIKRSTDQGASWETKEVEIAGLPSDATELSGFYVMKPWHAAKNFNKNLLYIIYGAKKTDNTWLSGALRINLK